MSTKPSASRILIIGPAWVGDLVMTQTLLKLLKQRQPDAVIDVLAPEWGMALLRCMPEVNAAIVSPFRGGELRLRERYQFAKKIRENKYDQAILIPNSFKSALIPFFAKIPKRTGWLGEVRYGIVNDARCLDKKRLTLMIQRFAALGLAKHEALPEKLPWPTLQVSAQTIQTTLEKFNVTTQRPLLVLCPGAEYGAAKRWPAEYFAEVARTKIAEGWSVLLLGSPKERALAEQIQQHTQQGCIDLIGKTTLAEAVYLLAACQQVVANDSGLMHVAAALQKNVLALYGSTPANLAPPLCDNAKILTLNLSCSPCFERECPLGHFKCMRDLKPAAVLSKLS